MKVYPHLFAKLFASPMLIRASVREALERELLGRMGVHGEIAIGQDHPLAAEPRSAAARRRMNAILEIFGDVAVIHVDGIIDKAISDFEMDCYGGCDLNDINNALSVAADDPRVSTIVLNMSTPGGSATGVAETAARISALRDRKEMHAYIDTLCCSAGYWLASQCDVIACAGSAITGSIGVYMALLDATKALELEGLKVNLIKAGKFKAMGASFKELTDEERAMLQKEVDDIYGAFTAACTGLRNIASEAMQGQHFTGLDALAAGLVDRLTAHSLDEYVSSLLGN